MSNKLFRRVPGWVRGAAVTAAFAVIVVVLMLWLAGRFSPKLAKDELAPADRNSAASTALMPVRLARIPVTETAAGTIGAVHETRIASKVLARVVEVNLKAGQAVASGEVLVRLDDKDVRARLQQAEAQLASANAALEQAERDEKRLRDSFAARAASEQEYDRAKTAVTSGQAEVQRAQEQVNEARAVLEYTVIRAPMDGVVVDKKVDVGDTVSPGQVLLTFFDPKRMQLVASVRESLAYRLAVGQSIGVHVDVLNKTCAGEVSEIVPESQSASRTFQVKVSGPCPPGIYSGMFGRIIIPMGDEQALLVRKGAVEKVGQLEFVEVSENGQLHRRAIRTGRVFGDDYEVLSGLREGEQVAMPLSPSTQGVPL
jgi:RND family efflux transporter MFP subunit